MNSTILLGTDVQSGQPVELGLRERQQGMYIIGRPGTGKTTLIEHMVVQDMEAGLGLCVLDPHGDLVDAILARVPPEREHDVILLDAADTDFPFGLNMFECRDLTDRSLVGRVAAQSVEVFEKLWGDKSWGPQLAQVLRNCAYTMVENPGYTLTEMQLLLADEEFRSRLTANLTLPQAHQFWELEYNPLPRREQQQRVSSTLNKVDEFLTPAIYPIVGFGRTTVDFRQAMDDGKIVLVKLPVGQLGAGPVGLLGSMIVAQIFNAALSRQELETADRRQFNLFADEYHRFATPTFAELLAEARKYGVATTLAHQFRDQLDEANRGATLTAGNLIVFAVSGEDAEELAKQFDRTPPPPDVVGQRPKLTISQDPVGHLVRSGHDNPLVREIVGYELSSWVSQVSTMGHEDLPSLRFPGDPPFHQPYYYNRDALVSGLERIGRYLVDVMEGRVRVGAPNEVPHLYAIVEMLRGAMCVARTMRFQADQNPPLREEEAQSFRDYLEAFVQSPLGYRPVTSARERFAEQRQRAWGGSRQEVDRLDWYVDWLRQLAAALAEDPIKVDSGQWEPIYDRPRSYADVEGEVASGLVNLPKYRARGRLLRANDVVEYIIRTPDYRAPAEEDRRRDLVRDIRERTRRDYCAPIDDVLDAILERGRIPGRDNSFTQRRVPL